MSIWYSCLCRKTDNEIIRTPNASPNHAPNTHDQRRNCPWMSSARRCNSDAGIPSLSNASLSSVLPFTSPCSSCHTRTASSTVGCTPASIGAAVFSFQAPKPTMTYEGSSPATPTVDEAVPKFEVPGAVSTTAAAESTPSAPA